MPKYDNMRVGRRGTEGVQHYSNQEEQYGVINSGKGSDMVIEQERERDRKSVV